MGLRGNIRSDQERREIANSNGSSSTSSLPANSADKDGEFANSRPLTPQTVERQPYLQSPVKEKRKRMEELAARKKRR